MGIFGGGGGERGQKSAEYISQAQAEDKSPVMSYGETARGCVETAAGLFS